MCGYFGNIHESPVVIDLLNRLGIPLPYPQQRAYQRRMLAGFVSQQADKILQSQALWWYALKEQDGKLVPNEKITSFNARDLTKPLWQEAAKTRRGIVFATELGESQGKNKFLMRAEEGFALGCVYKDWVSSSGQKIRSFAVITRPPHERFSRYHDKSTPLFLPMEEGFIREWLDPNIEDSDFLQSALKASKIPVDLEVTPVKSYKNAEALSEAEYLLADK